MSTRIADALEAIAETLAADGLPCRRIAGATDPETLANMLLHYGRTGSAALTIGAFGGVGADDAGQLIEAQLLLYLVAFEEAGGLDAGLAHVERLAELIPGNQWGRPEAWVDLAGPPTARNQYAAIRAESGPGGVSLWTFTWSQTLRLAAPHDQRNDSLDPNFYAQ